MQIEWFGQSAFRIQAEETTVFIDPFGDVSPLASRGIEFDYPAIEGVRAELVLVTHEHLDHNGVEVIEGQPTVLRSTAGTLESPVGPITAVASEHDEAAGTQRGPNTIFAFELEGRRLVHFGDFGQSSLREEQARAIGRADVMFLPVGGGPTIGAAAAAAIVEQLSPAVVVPMHYRTPRISFLEPADEFLERFSDVRRLDDSSFDPASMLDAGSQAIVVVPAAP